MAISSDTTPEFNVGTIVLRGMQRAGYVSSQHSSGAPGFTQDFAVFSDFLEMAISDLSLEGLFAKSTKFLYQALTADVESYEVGEGTQRIFGDAVYIAESEANILRPNYETLIQEMTRQEYHISHQKGADASNPTHYFPDRQEGKVYVWPIPTEAGTIRFQVQRRLAAVQTATVTPDLQREWYNYLVYTVAEEVCYVKSFPLQRAAVYERKAKELLPKLKAQSNEGAVMDAVLVHPTQWS